MRLSEHVDRTSSLEELENDRWSDRSVYETDLVASCHTLRKRAVGQLLPHEIARLICQDIGLGSLVPIALDYLREKCEESEFFYDSDLMFAVLTRDHEYWLENSGYARHLRETAEMLTDLGPYLRDDISSFLKTVDRIV